MEIQDGAELDCRLGEEECSWNNRTRQIPSNWNPGHKKKAECSLQEKHVAEGLSSRSQEQPAAKTEPELLPAPKHGVPKPRAWLNPVVGIHQTLPEDTG